MRARLHKVRFLLSRRLAQVGILYLLFATAHEGFLGGVLDGDLTASKLFGAIPLVDPFAALQVALTGAKLTADLFFGALIIFGLYALLGRAFCGWVCPVNLISDAAAWAGRALKIKPWLKLPRGARWLTLALALILSALVALPAFEMISPIGLLSRAVIFGRWGVGWLLLALLLFELTVAREGWCGHLCPLGAFYNLTGRLRRLTVGFERAACTRCMDCHRVCPERQIITHLLNHQSAARITNGACLNCGRCVEVCEPAALSFKLDLRRPQ